MHSKQKGILQWEMFLSRRLLRTIRLTSAADGIPLWGIVQVQAGQRGDGSNVGWLWKQKQENHGYWKSRNEDIEWWQDRACLSQIGDISKQLATYRFLVKYPGSSRRYFVNRDLAKMVPRNRLVSSFFKDRFICQKVTDRNEKYKDTTNLTPSPRDHKLLFGSQSLCFFCAYIETLKLSFPKLGNYMAYFML